MNIAKQTIHFIKLVEIGHMNPASAVKVLLLNSFLIEENQEYFSTQKLLKVTFSKKSL